MADPKETAQQLGAVVVPDPEETVRQLGGVAVPDPQEPEGDELSRAIANKTESGQGQSESLYDSLIGFHPVQDFNTNLAQARDLWNKGQYTDSIRNFVAGYMLRGVPGVAALNQAGNEAQRGEVGPALWDTALGAGEIFLPQIAEGMGKAGAEVLSGETPEFIRSMFGGGRRTPAGAPAMSDREMLSGIVPTPSETLGAVTPTKRALEVYRPKNALKFADDWSRGMTAVKEVDPKVNLNSLDSGIDTALHQNQAKFDTYMDRAGKMGLTMDGNQYVDRQLAAVPQLIRETNPEGYLALKKSLEPLRRDIAPGEMKGFLETTNDQLNNFYNGLEEKGNIQLGANAHLASTEAGADAARDLLYGKIDPETEGANVRDLQRRIGALKAMKGQHEIFRNKMAITQSPSWGQTTASALGDIVNTAGLGVPKIALKAVANAGKTPTEIAISDATSATASRGKLDKAIRDFKPRYTVRIPEAGAYPIATTGPATDTITRQLPPPTPRITTPDTTQVRVTTGPLVPNARRPLTPQEIMDILFNKQ